MKAFLAIVAIIMVPVGMVWWAYAATCAWLWLVVPTWHVPELTIMQALAAASIRGLLFMNIEMAQHFQLSQSDKADEEEKLIRAILSVLIGPLIAIIIAAILSLFV